MPPSAPARPTRRRRLVLAALTAVVASTLAGCITGERPVLEPERAINDPEIEAVLERLDRAGSGEFTAVYDIIPSTPGISATATVIRLESGRTLITIGNVEYLIDGSVTRTCVADECVDQIDDAPISDLNITHRFWGESFAARLELDATRNLRDGRGRADTIAGRPAACVEVEVIGGTLTYCALDAGVLARYFGADVSIELTSYSTEVDPDAFAR